MAVLTQAWLLALFIIGRKAGAGLAGFPPSEIVFWLLRGVIGGLAVIALQLLLSMVIRNFALPVLIALCGSVAGLRSVSKDAGLYWPYSLMNIGMNSNRTEDVMACGIWGFFLSCTVFLTVFLLIANILLTKQDVNA